MENPHPETRVTLRDIAQVVGITHGAVSLALRDSPRISEATRARVHAVAREMGYQPNPLAAGLAHFKRNSSIIPVHAALAWLNLWPDPERLRSFQEFDLYWQGACSAAQKFGYRLDEFLVNEKMPPRRVQQVLMTRNIQGIIIPPAPPAAPSFDWSEFEWEKFSVIRFGRAHRGLPFFNLVTSAQAANASLAFSKILEKGYERIGYIGHQTNVWTYLGGFLQAQAVTLPLEKRIPPLLLPEDSSFQAYPKKTSSEDLKRFLAWIRRWQPDAILTETAKTLQFIEHAGPAFPKEIGLAAMNVLDLPIDAGINQNPKEVGRAGVLAVISFINDQAHGVPPIQREILVRGEWVDGASLPPRK